MNFPYRSAEPSQRTASDPVALALQALAWSILDPERAGRLLATTGLAPADLRERAGDPALLGAILAFLEAYEPDLLACAEALGVPPDRLTAARRALEA